MYAPVAGVLGNVDDGELARRLPLERTVEVAGVTIGMVHNAGPREGRRQRLRAAFPDARIVVFGHSHTPVIDDADGLLLLNPGSAIDRRREPECTMAVVRIEEGRVAASLVSLG